MVDWWSQKAPGFLGRISRGVEGGAPARWARPLPACLSVKRAQERGNRHVVAVLVCGFMPRREISHSLTHRRTDALMDSWCLSSGAVEPWSGGEGGACASVGVRQGGESGSTGARRGSSRTVLGHIHGNGVRCMSMLLRSVGRKRPRQCQARAWRFWVVKDGWLPCKFSSVFFFLLRFTICSKI